MSVIYAMTADWKYSKDGECAFVPMHFYYKCPQTFSWV